MIRPLTLLTLLAAAGAGLHLYQVKHSVSLLDKELRDIHKQTEEAFERTQVLRGSWARLNEPSRLQQQAEQYLTLEPMQPAQFVRMADAMQRLPQAIAFNGAPSLFASAQKPEEPRTVEPAPQTRMASVTAAPAPAASRPVAPPVNTAQAQPLAQQQPQVAARVTAPAVAAAQPARTPAPQPQAQPDAGTAIASLVAPRNATAAEYHPRPAPQQPTRLADATPRQPIQPAPAPAREKPAREAARDQRLADTRPASPSPLLRQETPQVIRPAEPILRQAMHIQPPVPYVGSSLGGAQGGSALGASRPSLAPPVPYGAGNVAR
ncbi:hypothetical protein IAI18_02175 [Acetobacteraceae bacterium H6797]|nr:hypothetical protein [Acetobacteraceae bacterium H6797]